MRRIHQRENVPSIDFSICRELGGPLWIQGDPLVLVELFRAEDFSVEWNAFVRHAFKDRNTGRNFRIEFLSVGALLYRNA